MEMNEQRNFYIKLNINYCIIFAEKKMMLVAHMYVQSYLVLIKYNLLNTGIIISFSIENNGEFIDKSLYGDLSLKSPGISMRGENTNLIVVIAV